MANASPVNEVDQPLGSVPSKRNALLEGHEGLPQQQQLAAGVAVDQVAHGQHVVDHGRVLATLDLGHHGHQVGLRLPGGGTGGSSRRRQPRGLVSQALRLMHADVHCHQRWCLRSSTTHAMRSSTTNAVNAIISTGVNSGRGTLSRD